MLSDPQKPNAEANVASVTIPFVTRMQGKITGKFQELVIVSGSKVDPPK
jgi:hypothetical protein